MGSITSLILIIAVLLTSILSGVFAMGGGVILLAVLLNLLPVQKAMVYHGVIQFFANGFRALISWRFISLKVMSYYLVGTALGSFFLFQIVYRPEKAYLLLVVGLLTLIGPYVKYIRLDITKPWEAILGGIFIVWLNTLAGASGPLLNMFFLKSPMGKMEIIATKSATQTVAHFIKILFYSTAPLAVFTTVSADGSGGGIDWLLIVLCAITFLGGWIGKKIVDRMSEAGFRRYGFWIISAFGLAFTIQGIYLMLS